MLEWIDIRNFVIARHVELEFQSGLSVITGETGAGKSIIIDALALVLGERTKGNVVRHGEDRAEIQASFDISGQAALLKWLKDEELDDDDQCVVRRVIPKQRSSKAFVNGRSVPASVLRELGQNLLDIHSQHEHQSLLRPDTQRQILDRFAQVEPAVQSLAALFDELYSLRSQLSRLQANAAESQDRMELLQFQLQELDDFAPAADEWAELEQSHQKLNHTADLDQALNTALGLLEDNEAHASSPQLLQAQQQLQNVAAYEHRLQEPIDILDEAHILLGEASQRLRHIVESSELDPAQLADIERRFSNFHELARKHRVGPEALYEVQQSLQHELQQLSNPEEEQLRLQSMIKAKQADYFKQAKSISAARQKASKLLMQQVTDSMQNLAMEGGFFQISLNPLNTEASDNGSRYGMENINFEVSTNRGMPADALNKVASGGELSRISLAIQVIIADIATVSTLVFDEVDVGVGGKTAATVGNLLRQLGEKRQIICITHLPQVAARGQHHFNVNKYADEFADSGEAAVLAEIIPLGDSQRVEEIARMVGGENITEESLAHARSLINAA